MNPGISMVYNYILVIMPSNLDYSAHGNYFMAFLFICLALIDGHVGHCKDACVMTL